MQSLEALTRDARALANGDVVPAAPLTGAESEVARQMQICNACRYCEGFCAVFPAMTRRLEFGKADIHFLANICHNCGACLHACQYAPPHAFAVNVPQAMAQVRGQTYGDYAWPPALGALYQRQGLTLSLALAAGLALFLVLAVVLKGQGLGALWIAPGGTFYGIFPHNLLVGLFAPVFLFATLALAMGVRRFWRDVTPATSGAPLSAPATAEAADAKSATKIADVLRGFSAMLSLQAGQKAELAQIADSISVATEDDKVHVKATITHELLESLKKSAGPAHRAHKAVEDIEVH